MYDYTKASDLVKWALEQYKKPNRYKNGGIGRYDSDGTRQFDCCGLFKCFMWHDYSTNNSKYYGKIQKDKNCEGLLAEAKEKGDISTIPEIPGVLVYQKGHMGIYAGKGVVVESTAAKYNGKQGKIYKTYFKGSGKGCDGKRTTWTKWFKSPYLTYNVIPTQSEIPTQPTNNTQNKTNKFFTSKGYFSYGDKHENIGKVSKFLYKTFPAYTKKEALGNYYGKNIKASITEFQKRTGLEADGCIGPKTLAQLVKYGFKY